MPAPFVHFARQRSGVNSFLVFFQSCGDFLVIQFSCLDLFEGCGIFGTPNFFFFSPLLFFLYSISFVFPDRTRDFAPPILSPAPLSSPSNPPSYSSPSPIYSFAYLFLCEEGLLRGGGGGGGGGSGGNSDGVDGDGCGEGNGGKRGVIVTKINSLYSL